MQQVADWLEKLGLGQYAQRFAENDISFSVLPDLTDQHLKEIGVSLGHRLQLLRAIAELTSRERDTPAFICRPSATSWPSGAARQVLVRLRTESRYVITNSNKSASVAPDAYASNQPVTVAQTFVIVSTARPSMRSRTHSSPAIVIGCPLASQEPFYNNRVLKSKRALAQFHIKFARVQGADCVKRFFGGWGQGHRWYAAARDQITIK
jgi:hypothetical protein